MILDFFSINFVPNEQMIESMCWWMLTNLKWFNYFIAAHSSLTTSFIGMMFSTNVSLMRASNLIQFCHLDMFSVIVAPNKNNSRDLLWIKICHIWTRKVVKKQSIWKYGSNLLIDMHCYLIRNKRNTLKKTHRICFHLIRTLRRS